MAFCTSAKLGEKSRSVTVGRHGRSASVSVLVGYEVFSRVLKCSAHLSRICCLSLCRMVPAADLTGVMFFGQIQKCADVPGCNGELHVGFLILIFSTAWRDDPAAAAGCPG